jgi:Ras-related protein Rab-7L1
MTRVYYRRASACVIMFDVAQPNSFHNAAKWKKDLDSKCFNSSGKNIPCILVANKVSILFCSVVTYNTTQRHFLNLCST